MSHAEDLLSSPDPLNDTPTLQAPPSRRVTRSRHSLSLQNISPNKQTFELNVSDQLSPRKIRVTVEAGSDIENSPSPVRKRVNRHERTTTTKVPVKGLSDTEDDTTKVATPKRGRGRPRKSTGTPAKKPTRAATPTRKGKRRSIGSLIDGDDEEDRNFRIGHNVEVRRGKGRSRSRSANERSRKETPAPKEAASPDRNMSSTASKKGRGRRKTLLPDEVEVLEDARTTETETETESPAPIEMSGALTAIDHNILQPNSQYSTMWSATTAGSVRSDVLLARFDPGNETPRKLDWSSPRNAESHPSNTSRESAVSYTQPEDAAMSQSGGDDMRNDEEDRGSVEGFVDECGGFFEDEQEQHGEIEEEGEHARPENATIMESEGFSMISVDSVPSMQANRSSPLPQQTTPATKHPKHKNIAMLQKDDLQDDSFSSIPEEILEAATPGRKVTMPNQLATQHSPVDDTFSSIPSKILAAATPKQKSHVSRLNAREKSRKRSSSPQAAPDGPKAKASSAGQSQLKSIFMRPPSQKAAYEDSFSAIPSAILDAASPVKSHEPSLNPQIMNATYEDSFSVIPSAILDAASPVKSQQPLLKPTAGIHGSSPSDKTYNRLPTPEKTPSPPHGEVHYQGSGKPTDQLLPETNSSIMQSYMRSSPPLMAPQRYTYTAHLRRQSLLNPDTTHTPAIVFSSPTLPPLKQAPPAGNSVHSQGKPLFPAVQAGRMLQNITVPSPSRDRSQSLGSPFRSPNAERKSSSKKEQGSQDGLPKEDLIQRENQGDIHVRSQARMSNPSSQNEDPFSSNAINRTRSMTTNGYYSLGLPRDRASTIKVSSFKDADTSFDAMSWQAEEEIAIDQPVGKSSVNDNFTTGQQVPSGRYATNLSWQQRQAAERAAVSKQIKDDNTSQVFVIESEEEGGDEDEDDDDAAGEADGDEELGLLMETLDSSSPAVQRREPPKLSTVDRPRRSKLPSPWRKNSKRLIYSDELSKLSPEHQNIQLNNVGSVIERPQIISKLPPARPAGQSQQVDHDIDITAFTPAPILQKANFKPRPRVGEEKDLSALLAPSPVKNFQALLSERQSNVGGPKGDSPLFKPESTRNEGSVGLDNLTLIPQKQGFEPRVRDRKEPSALFSSPTKPNTHFVRGIFGTIPANTSPQAPSTISEAPSKSSLKNADTTVFSVPDRTVATSPVDEEVSEGEEDRDEVEEGDEGGEDEGNSDGDISTTEQDVEDDEVEAAGEFEEASQIGEEDDDENSSPERESASSRTRKWAQKVNFSTPTNPFHAASPPKSILRSPLKTPVTTRPDASPRKSVAWASASTVTTPIPAPKSRVSSTEWTNANWHLLQKILNRHRAALPPPSSPSASPTQTANAPITPSPQKLNNTRVISTLVGRNVHSGRYRMAFEQWHLEVTAEFRDKVPGWDEKFVAGSAFALLGQEEIKAGRLPRRGEKGDEDGKIGEGGEWTCHRCGDGRTRIWRWLPDEKEEKGWLGWLWG